MEYSFCYLLWNENTCKTHKKQVFQNKYSNPKREFLLSIIKNDFGIITFTNCRGEKIFVYRFLKAIVFRVPM
jgi:hypothetical protein